jgi:uncharacterized membrane-anchored protein
VTRARVRAAVIENWPVLILVALVAVSGVHTFVSLRAAAYVFGAVALLLIPIGGGMVLHCLVEGRWPWRTR